MKFNKWFFDVVISGDFIPNEYEGFFFNMLNDKNWKPGTPVLIDETNFLSKKLSIEEIKEIANQCVRLRHKFGPAKCAIFVSRDLEFGVNRMGEVFVENEWDVVLEFFRSREDAIEWLGNDSE
ncbi:MAG: hypothetical protein GY760_22810 [Deltaproteobacteria bacterium]|nr:hypothetical protein [Deltaproteobacteria bacterium]